MSRNTVRKVGISIQGDKPSAGDIPDEVIDQNISSGKLYDTFSGLLLNSSAGHELQKEHTGLTDREKDVLKQVALGLSNKEIAEKLFITVHTVVSHM